MGCTSPDARRDQREQFHSIRTKTFRNPFFAAFVADFLLRYTSLNAPKKRDVLGTAMLSMLAGHKRYAHMTSQMRAR